MKRTALVAVAVMALLSVMHARAAVSDDFAVKWPWNWQSSASIGTYPFSGVHGCYPNGEWPWECAAAYDFTIADDGVLSSKEGIVTFAYSQASGCGPDMGYGNYVEVAGIRYAHLSVLAPSVVEGAHLFQGDRVGTQGHTGNVLPCDPDDPQSGKHLHWQFLSGTVPTIDGGSGTSSNSLIGEFSTSGATLRSYFQSHGSFSLVGWTHRHCPGTCTLNMTANKTWGRMQDFRHDPDFLAGEFDTIHVAVWNLSQAFLVDSISWPAWAGINPPIGMAISERGSCPAGSSSSCASYQKFHLGLFWMDQYWNRQAVFCPDLNGDQRVDLSELIIESQSYNQPPVPPAVEVKGDNYKVDTADLVMIAGVYLLDCHV